jgi:hypothetical protein
MRAFAVAREHKGFMVWTPWIVGWFTWDHRGRFANGRRFWVITSRSRWEQDDA